MVTTVLAFTLLLYPPGYLASLAYPPLAREDFWTRVGLRLLLGLAFWPLLLAVTTVCGLSLMTASLRAITAVLAVLALAAAVAPGTRFLRRSRIEAIALLLALTLAATGVLRWWQVRAVAWPLWGDAVNHTAATILVVQHGAVPPNWEPFIPTSQTFTYHFGFHAWAAALHWLAGTEPWWAVFWTERFLSVLAPLGLYILANTLFQDSRVALGAAIIVGLLTKMPQYYVNWSRDPQLGGQTLLPLIAYFALAAARPGRWAQPAAALAALSVSSLVLVHYRALVFAACLLPGLAIVLTGPARRRLRALLALGIPSLAGLFLASPWLYHVLRIQRQVVSLTAAWHSEEFAGRYFAMPPLTEYVRPAVLALAVLGMGIALAKHRRGAAALLVWLVFLLLSANGYRFRVRGLDLITYISVFMGLYLLMAPFAGMALAWLATWLRPLPKAWQQGAAVLLAAILIGFVNYGDIIDDTYVLVESDDVAAFRWVAANTPPQASFLINSFFVSGPGSTVVSSDAGWWLPLVSGRAASVPVINYTTEVISPQYRAQVQELASLSLDDILAPEGPAELCRRGIDFIYTGAVGGRLDPERIAGSGLYRPVFQHGQARVFAVDCKR